MQMEKGATGRPFCFHGKPRGSADEAADDEELADGAEAAKQTFEIAIPRVT